MPLATSTTPFSPGRILFGTAILASGALQLATGDFVRLVPALPAWVPAASAWAYLVGVVLVTLGLAVLSSHGSRSAASLLGVMILLVVVLLYAPTLIWNGEMEHPFLRGVLWTNPLKSMALVGGAAILAASAGEERPLTSLVRALAGLAPWAALMLAVFLVVCGVQHFVYADFVTTLVPSWVPAPRFWTYFAGVALVAGGFGLLVRRTVRLAGNLTALMIFSWVVVLHIPRAVAGPNHANETAGVFEALAISGVAVLVAATRATPPEPGPA
jgi:uncharacterized membrane protein